MIVNGVTVPDIPADVLANNPCATITHIVSGTSETYTLNALKNPWNYIGAEVWNPLMGSMLPLEDGGGILFGDAELVYVYTCHEGDSAWTAGNPSNDPMSPVGPFEGSVYTLVWSSHDITEITALNPETGAFTYGDVWFAKSAEEKPSPTRYSIAKAILDAVARQIMRLTDSSVKLAPEDYEPMLETVKKGGGGGLSFASTASGGLLDYDHSYAVSLVTFESLNFESSATMASA